MSYRTIADTFIVIHLLFMAFVVFGGLLVLVWPRLAWAHVPSFVWGAFVEFSNYPCPLTTLENHLRRVSGQPGYNGGFVDHYVAPILYPAGLTRDTQIVIGAAVLVINFTVYAILIARARRQSSQAGGRGFPVVTE